jgi:hypothetical protein
MTSRVSSTKIVQTSVPTQEELALQRIAEQVATLKTKVDDLAKLTAQKPLNLEKSQQQIFNITQRFQQLQGMVVEDDWVMMDENTTQAAIIQTPQQRRMNLVLDIRAIFASFSQTFKTFRELMIMPIVIIVNYRHIATGFGKGLGGAH